MRIFIILSLLLCSCSNILIPDYNLSNSIHLNGRGWIRIDNVEEYNCDYGLRVMDNSFSLEIFFSGAPLNNDAKTIFSITGKNTENFSDNNCNSEFEPENGEDDENGDGVLDQINNNEFVTLSIANQPSNSGMLTFYVNDNYQDIEFSEYNFGNSDEFHLMQIISDGDSLWFYIDNNLAHSVEQSIMLQGSNLIIGAKENGSTVGNIWDGYIDEVRLWSGILDDELREMHYEFPNKLVETMQDSSICHLRGLWSFNYSSPQINIPDEKCSLLESLYYNVCDVDICEYPLDGTLYTLPGTEVNFSSKGF